MKVLIADDHDLVREGIAHVLQRIDAEVELLHARDYSEVLELIPDNTDVDFVLIDLSMPGLDPFEGLAQVRECAPNVPLIVLSASEKEDDIRRALDCGIRGYIPKSASNQVMLAAIELVLSGGVYVPPALIGVVAGGASSEFLKSQNIQRSTNPAGVKDTLTRRQKEVLELLSTGKTNKEIGRDLGLSEGTVRTHVTAIFRALNVSNRTEAGHVAMQLGLIGTKGHEI